MVIKPLFETVIRKYHRIASLEGDIVECGVLKGGYSIFLSHLFNNKKYGRVILLRAFSV
jgi:hypothetical protein